MDPEQSTRLIRDRAKLYTPPRNARCSGIREWGFGRALYSERKSALLLYVLSRPSGLCG